MADEATPAAAPAAPAAKKPRKKPAAKKAAAKRKKPAAKRKPAAKKVKSNLPKDARYARLEKKKRGKGKAVAKKKPAAKKKPPKRRKSSAMARGRSGPIVKGEGASMLVDGAIVGTAALLGARLDDMIEARPFGQEPSTILLVTELAVTAVAVHQRKRKIAHVAALASAGTAAGKLARASKRSTPAA